MNNAILFYYNLKPNEIIHNNNFYYFYVNNALYHLIIFYRKPEEETSIYKINNYMSRLGLPVHQIITNKDGKIITYIDNIPYILYNLWRLPVLCLYVIFKVPSRTQLFERRVEQAIQEKESWLSFRCTRRNQPVLKGVLT